MEYPSVRHWELLVSARRSGPLGRREREQYFAYDYGWRRVTLGDFARTSPIDRTGERFDPAESARTEAMWRRHFCGAPKQAKRDETPPRDASAEDRRRFRAQWDELGRLRPAAAWEVRTGIERGPAALAFVAAAARMVRENMAVWAEKQRQRSGRAPETAAVIVELQRELGIGARPIGPEPAE